MFRKRSTKIRSKTKRFYPAVDAMESRLLLSTVHALGYAEGYAGDVSMGGYGNYSTDSNGAVKVAVGSQLHFWTAVVSRQADQFSGADLIEVDYSTNVGKLVSADPANTGYSYVSGNYLASTSLADTAHIATGLVGSAGDADYASWAGGNSSGGWGRYNVAKGSLYVDGTLGLRDLRVTIKEANNPDPNIPNPDHVDFMIDVVEPNATLNATFQAGDTYNSNGEAYKFGPYLNYSDASGDTTYVRQTLSNWADPSFVNSIEGPNELGITTNFRFGAISGGLNPEQFSASVQNTTPNSGQFYTTNLASIPASVKSIYNPYTHLVTVESTFSPTDQNENPLFGLDATQPQGSPAYGIPDWAWSGGSGLGMSVIQGANSSAGSYTADSPVPSKGLNKEILSFVRDSPSITIDPNLDARSYLLTFVNHEVDFKTDLVFQSDQGIPIVITEKDWLTRSMENYIGPNLSTMSAADAWAAVYTNPDNWQGNSYLTPGASINTPSILAWSYNANTLTPDTKTKAYQADPGILFDNALSQSAWTSSQSSGNDTWSDAVGQGQIFGEPLDGPIVALTSFEADWGVAPPAFVSTDLSVNSGTYDLSFYAADITYVVPGVLQVVVDGQVVGTFTPSSTITKYDVSLNLSAGSHSIGFLVPDPATGQMISFEYVGSIELA